ncbi:MAG: hypothetical protein ACJAW8_001612 [Oleispira sp.]|jgi:hypothetical protein
MHQYREQTYKPLKRNPNLTVSRYWTYAGIKVQHYKGPLITQYLDQITNQLNRSLNEHTSVIVLRFDLHFPVWFDDDDMAQLKFDIITKFWESFKAQLKACVNRMKKQKVNVTYSNPRYIWCKERDLNKIKHHYHCALILNKEMYEQILEFHLDENLIITMLEDAWARCLGHSAYEVEGTVYIPQNAVYHVDRGNFEQFDDVFYRLSYLAKTSTKWFDDGSQWFGSSRG